MDWEATLPEQPESQGRGSNVIIIIITAPMMIFCTMDSGEDVGDLVVEVVGDTEPLQCVDEPELCRLVVTSAHHHQPLPHFGLQLIEAPSSQPIQACT